MHHHLVLSLLLCLAPSCMVTTPMDNQKRIARALLVVDVQNCFIPEGGTLAVAGGDEVIPIINHIRKELVTSFDLVVLSQDWHCPDHVSFASQHPRYGVLNNINLHYDDEGNLCRTVNVTNSYATQCTGERHLLRQTLWPDHCIKNTTDSQLHPDLYTREDDVIIQKGHNCQLDSYSVFYDNGRFGETALRQILGDNGVGSVYIVGLATDYCVYWSALDAKEMDMETYVILDATRGVSQETTQSAVDDMRAHDINIIQSADLDTILTSRAVSFTITRMWFFMFVIVIGSSTLG